MTEKAVELKASSPPGCSLAIDVYTNMQYLVFAVLTNGNPDAKRLFDDLLSSYNKLVRPVINVTDAVTVKFKLKLSQLIDVVSPTV